MNFFQKYLLPLSVAGLWLSIFVIFYLTLYVLGISLEEFIFLIYDFMKDNILMGAVLFLIIFLIRPFVFITASPFDMFAGAVFGLFWGMIICMIANILSCILSYGVGKSTRGVFLNKLPEAGKIKKLKGKIEKNTFSSVVMMRLLFFPFDLTSYFCGVFKIRFTPYVFATALAGIPAVFIFVLAGAAFYGQEISSLSEVAQNVNYNYLFLASGLFLISIIISKILKKKYKW